MSASRERARNSHVTLRHSRVGIDSTYIDDPDGYVSPEAIRGAWLVDDNGKLNGGVSQGRSKSCRKPPREKQHAPVSVVQLAMSALIRLPVAGRV